MILLDLSTLKAQTLKAKHSREAHKTHILPVCPNH